jgi:hypothetical protein
MSTLSESSSEPSWSSARLPARSSGRFPARPSLSARMPGPSARMPGRSGTSRMPGQARPPGPWRRLSLLVVALLVTVSCMPAHVVSDTAREGEPRERSSNERPSKTYHVQVRTVEAKSEADRAVTEVTTWFNGLDRDERPLPLSRVSTVPVDVRWKAPFYRVRVGPFTSKEAAESVLQSVQRRFPNAFIAKEIIKDDPASRRTFWYDSPAGSLDDWNRDRDWSRDPDDWSRRDDAGPDDTGQDDARRDGARRDGARRDDWKREERRRDRVGDTAESNGADGGDRKDNERDDDEQDGGW